MHLNKTKSMKETLIISLMLALSYHVSAQDRVGYTYDAAGNRIKKEIVLNSQQAIRRQMADAVSETLSEKTIRIYPNPTKGRLKVDITGYEHSDKCTLLIVNMAGQQVLSSNASSASTELNLSSQPNGLYILRIKLNDEESTWKIIKK